MAPHAASALRTTLGALALFASIAACRPHTDAPLALAERVPAARPTPVAPAQHIARPSTAEPLPSLGCGSERNPCAIEGITVTAPRQLARSSTPRLDRGA